MIHTRNTHSSKLSKWKCILTLLLLTAGAFAQSPNLAGFHLVWEDDFTGTQLDPHKWKIIEGKRWGAMNTASAARIEDHCLKICPITVNGVHETAMISSEDGFNFSQGYCEAKVKLETKSGAWSDLWLYSATVATIEDDINKAGAEIDIFEHRAADGNQTDLLHSLVHGIHWNGYGGKHQNVATTVHQIIDNQHFHKIGLLWTSSEYTFFVDGREVWKTDQGVTSKPLFILLSVEIKDHFWAGNVPKGGYHGEPMMSVDYVRVFKRDR